jgi:hypothetical protein
MIDVSNPATPQRVAGYDTSGEAQAYAHQWLVNVTLLRE